MIRRNNDGSEANSTAVAASVQGKVQQHPQRMPQTTAPLLQSNFIPNVSANTNLARQFAGGSQVPSQNQTQARSGGLSGVNSSAASGLARILTTVSYAHPRTNVQALPTPPPPPSPGFPSPHLQQALGSVKQPPAEAGGLLTRPACGSSQVTCASPQRKHGGPVAGAQRVKRMKLEEKSEQEIAALRAAIVEYRLKEMAGIKSVFTERVTELFFLQNGGNMVDMIAWKKRPGPHLAMHLRTQNLDSEDEEATLVMTPMALGTSTAVFAHASGSSVSAANTVDVKPSKMQLAQAVSVPLSDSSPTLMSSLTAIPTLTSLGSQPLSVDTSSPKVTAVGAVSTSVSGASVDEKVPQMMGGPVTCSPRDMAASTSVNANASSAASPVKSPRCSSSATSPMGRLPTRQRSISAVYDSTIGSQEEIVERAKQEAYVMQRIAELRKEGLWSERRLPKVQEPPRNKAHWDYLLEEMVWLATDFAQERKWKKSTAKKCAKMCQKFHMEQKLKEERAEKEAEQKLRRIAGGIAKDIKQFWSNVEKLVEFKQQSWLEEKRKKALDLHLNFIMDQTEKYSSWLTQGMNKAVAESGNTSVVSSVRESRASSPVTSCNTSHSDADFEPASEESDDEETIAKSEESENTSREGHLKEIEALQREGELPLAELLKGLPPEIVKTRAAVINVETSSDEESSMTGPAPDDKGALVDADFQLSVVDDSSDDEDTIIEQEKAEKGVDHSQELKDLQDEGEMPFEELWKKYGAAYANDAADSDNSESVDSSDTCESSDNETEEGSEDENGKSADDSLDIGLESLINPVNREAIRLKTGDDLGKGPSKEISDIAAAAERFQPKGYTYSTAQVVTKVPFLLKHQLREYQHIGLDWLVTMYDRKLNGILADEMGLGKTIQTIALLAHLACEKSNWGPHLIVVPTSVMLNWEMEIKKWCPAFKILTYYGTQKERKQKRQGWTKPNFFHICITSYKLVIQDHQSFRRKRWKYFILDEAQNIKNFKSQRWQLLLNFQSQRRLLLTGTPLQNSLMELWSLMHFLMPNVFQSHRDFKEWFANPVSGMIEGSQDYNEGLIKRLHKVLRPFLLRRIKSEVEKQLPMKFEHIVFCRLSKRQRFLYDDFMSQSKTKETLASGNFMSVINVLMQLRKVCNHPNLFEARPTISPFQMEGIEYVTASLAESALDYDPLKHANLFCLNLLLADLEQSLTAFAAHQIKRFQTPRKLIEEINVAPDPPPKCPAGKIKLHVRTAPSTPQTPKYSVNLNTAPQKIAISRTASPGLGNVSAAQTKTILNPQPQVSMSSPLPQVTGITLQLVQQPSQGGISVAQLTTSPMVTSTPITVQLQHTQQGPRLTVPPGQLAQITVTQNQKLPQVPVTTAWSQILVPSTGSFTQIVPSTNTISTISSNAGNSSTPGKAMIKISPATSTVPSAIGGLRSSTRVEAEKKVERDYTKSIFHLDALEMKRRKCRSERLQRLAKFNNRRCEACPIYGGDLVQAVNVLDDPVPVGPAWRGCGYVHCVNAVSNVARPPSRYWSQTDTLHRTVLTPEKLLTGLRDIFSRFVLVVPAVMAPPIGIHVSHPPPSRWLATRHNEEYLRRQLAPKAECLHPISGAMTTQFPDPRLIQYDCGKLQVLDRLLRQLKVETHRVLIFTQMTRMLDVLEQFLNFHGHIYLRLDGTTKVEQRQALMERFNADRRIFCFILSTRSGGIGVNLTGADTVIFYDSDWNPTMDAQAQDRCHRIGQTRDVHIYRLISERTVEENILRKANQKRLLGEVAIEGGNFTTAFFQKHTLKELFDMNFEESKKPEEIVRVVTGAEQKQASDDITTAQLEHALAQAEEDTDVDACKTAKAEAAAELAEFDESISLDGFDDDSSKLDEELASQMTPIERYAMAFLESTQDAFSLEQLKQAEEEIEAQKKDWELGRLQALKEEEERRAQLEDDDIPYTYSREDAYNQVYVSLNTREQMPMWAPPTPPQEENDVYIDYTLCFLFEPNVLPESQLPPVYVHKEQKRSRVDAAAVRKQKVRREDAVCMPRSLFDRPSAAVLKMRRDLKLHRIKSVMRSQPPAGYKTHHQPGNRASIDGDRDGPDWLVHEDWALLQAVQGLQELPLNLTVLSPAHTPNWDLVAEVVNATSCSYRSPKQCKLRYDCVVIPREEGRAVYDANAKKQKKAKNLYRTKSNRTMRTSQLFVQDNNSSLSQLFIQRFEVVKAVASKRTPTLKLVNPTHRNPKHSAILAENHINYDQPSTPVQLAANRAERIAREKKIQQTAAVPQAIAAVVPQVTQNMTGVVSGQVTSQQQLQTIVSRAVTIPGQPSVSQVPTVRTQRAVPTALTMQDMLAGVSHSRGVQPSTSAVTQAVVSPVQVAPQRVSVTPTASPPGVQNASAAQLQLLRNPALYKQQRLQVAQQQAGAQKVSTSGVTTVQVGQQQQRAQVAKQNVKQTVARSMTDIEMAQFIKSRQQKTAQVAQIQVPTQGQSTPTQMLTQAQLQQMQQHQATSPAPVATLVKTVSAPTSISAAGSTCAPLPVSTVTMGGVNINLSLPAPQGKAVGAKGSTLTAQQQQQLQHQMKLQQQRKLQLAQIQGKNQLSTQLGTVQILQQQAQGHKTIPATVTVQQIQQVMKQVQPQNMGHLSQVAGSSLASATVSVNQPQALPHTVLAKPSAVTLAQSATPSTAGSLHAGAAALQARMMHAGQTTTTSQNQVSAFKQAIQVVISGTNDGVSHTAGQIHQAQLRTVTAASPNMAIDSQGRVQTIVSSPSVTVSLPSSSSSSSSSVTQQTTVTSNILQQQGHGGAK